MIPLAPQKDLVLGVFANYAFDALKPWVRSIKATGFAGDVVIVSMGADPATTKLLEQEGARVVAVPGGPKEMAWLERFVRVYEFLRDTKEQYRYVVLADMRDVVFQRDPSEWMDKHFAPTGKKLLVTSEAMKIQHEFWNVDAIRDCLGEYFVRMLKDNEIQNGGIIAGDPAYVRDACLGVFQIALQRPKFGADQAAYNFLLHQEPWKAVSLFTTLSDAWVLNSQVTSQPHRMAEYGPNLLQPRPTFDGQLVRNAQGEPFVIVHQYDRVPDWTEHFTKKFE